MANNDLDVVNRALGRAGGEPIDSLDDDSTPLSAFCHVEWPRKKAWLLSKSRWVFATALAPLQQIALPANAPLPYAFARPKDIVGAVYGYWDSADERTRQPVVVQQMADYIACDQAAVFIEYTADRPVNAWPPGFEEFAVGAFAIDLARRMLRRSLADELTVEVFGPPEMNGQGGLCGAAMQEDSRNAPKRELVYDHRNDLVGARFGYGVGYGPAGAPGWFNNGFPFVIVPNPGE